MPTSQTTMVARAAAMFAAVVVSGCASQPYDPTPSANAPVLEFAFLSPLDVEGSYRVLYERLEACVGAGYHVQPRFQHEPEQAWIMVVSGLGLDRYSFLVNLFDARFQVDPSPGGSRVVVTYVNPDMEVLARASESWLLHGESDCRA